MRGFRGLELHPLPSPVGYFSPTQELPAQVQATSPAILVLTDLRQQAAVTVEPSETIDWALQRMKTAGVRLLFVINGDEQIQGIITAKDIQGEKPVRLLRELNLRHEEILVRDVMTPHEQLEVLYMDDVMKAAVGDIVATLQASGRRHALVLDHDPRSNRPAIRGLFSVSQISKQLGQLIEMTEVARTFAEVEVALNR